MWFLLLVFLQSILYYTDSSEVVTSQLISFPLLPESLCHVLQREGEVVQLAVNEDALVAELAACTEVSFEADFFSYFITLKSKLWSEQSQGTEDNWRHFESLPTSELLNSQWLMQQSSDRIDPVRLFSNSWKSRHWSPNKNQDKFSNTISTINSKVEKIKNICMLFGGEMDGMKRKAHMLVSSFPSESFQWSYWSDVAQKSKVTQNIIYELGRRENMAVFESVFGFPISPEDKFDAPVVPKEKLYLENLVSEIGPYDSFNTYILNRDATTGHKELTAQDLACEYMFLRLVMAGFNTNRAELSPPWVANAWQAVRDLFSTSFKHPPCNVLLFGNDKSALPLLLVGVARMLNIPSVMELPNLYPHPMVRPDFIVADSAFVLEHPSVKRLLSSSTPVATPKRYKDKTSLPLSFPNYQSTQAEIMCPGVDALALQQSVQHIAPLPCPDGCGSFLPLYSKITRHFTPQDRRHLRCGKCFTIGMVCRLSPEKSVGMFILAAAELVHTYSCTNCRFRIIGDGILRRKLGELTRRHELTKYLHFLGWMESKDMMAAAVSGWDVAVTTGAWRETFSIVGLELLALGVPLVTFATGGMGEYIADPILSQSRTPSKISLACSESILDFLAALKNSREIMDFDVHLPGNNTLCPFVVSENAVVVLSTQPQALALAIKYLDFRPSDRMTIGYSGILTVQNYFHINKTSELYKNFLLNIIE